MSAGLRFRVLASIEEIDPEVWDGLQAAGGSDVPFLRWGWIHALESSGSASVRTGWEAAHLTLWRGERPVAVAPAWRKFHSMGEYVYDFSWANAAEQMGVPYYPKLLVGVPLAPVTAPRIRIAPGEDVAAMRSALLEAATGFARETGCSSIHVIFPPAEEARAIEGLGFARRTGMQYHWKNHGYRTYEDYLARFGAKRRHQLRRERAAAAAQGITIRTLRGADGALDRHHADLAYRFYSSTVEKNGWGHVQLNRAFFRGVFEAAGGSIEMVLAERGGHEGDVIAGAFNVATPERLYGRYWGSFEEVPFLHFHVCLYHSIDDCIRTGRKVFEPGAGGEHKIPRGFEPTEIHSVHRIFDPGLDGAIRAFLVRERRHLAAYLENPNESTGMKPPPENLDS